MPEQELVQGDCLEVLGQISDSSFDAVVTDPPYELNMQNQKWDRTGIAFNVKLWQEILRVTKPGGHLVVHAAGRVYHRVACAIEDAGFEPREMVAWIFGTGQFLGRSLGNGVGTRLKTAAEPIGLFRKPGAPGGFQIERCRMPYEDEADLAKTKSKNPGRDDLYSGRVYGEGRPQQLVDEGGRLPSNALVDEAVSQELGDVARYFYCVKASRSERDAGLEAFPEISGDVATKRKPGTPGLANARSGAGRTGGGKNPHTTVKPLELTRRLVRLVAPPGALVLDPFAGSGTTLCAAALEGVSALGIEKESMYVPVAQARLTFWRRFA